MVDGVGGIALSGAQGNPHAPAIFRVADIRAALPGISDPTIRLVLDRLRREGVITSDGVGRTALWRRNPQL